MTRDDPARALLEQLNAESELLKSGNYGAALENLGSKRSLIDRTMANLDDEASRLAVRTAARRQQKLLHAALAGLSAARSHLLSAANPTPISSYSSNGVRHDHLPCAETTLKTL